MLQETVICGVVVGMPAVIRAHTRFLLRSNSGICVVIRTDCCWQRLDIVFLRPGQTVEVTGTPLSDHKIIARKIRITDTGLTPVKKEREYGNSSQ